jgi:hypothetical protein
MAMVSQELNMVVKTEVTKAIGDMQKFSNEVKKTGDQVKKMPKEILPPSAIAGVKKATKATGGLASSMNGVANMSRAASFQVVNLFEIMAMTQGPVHGLNYLMHQLMDSFALMGPGGLLVAGVVAGLGLIVRKFRGIDGVVVEANEAIVKSTQLTAEDLKMVAKDLDEVTKAVRNFGREAGDAFAGTLGRRESLLRMELGSIRSDAVLAQQDIKLFFEQVDRQVGKAGVSFKGASKAVELFNTGQMDLNKMQKSLFEVKALLGSGVDLPMLDALTMEGNEATRSLKKLERAGIAAGTVQKALNDTLKTQALHQKKIQLTQEAPFDPLEVTGKPLKPKKDDRAKRNKDMRDAWKDWDRHNKDLMKLDADRIREAERLRKEAEAGARSDAAFAVNFGVSLLKGAADIMVEGQRDMGAKLTALILQQVGTALVAKGTLWATEGVAMMILGVPNGGALAAQGAFAITAGVGMGAASKTITKGLTGGGGSSAMARRDSDMSTSGGGVPSAAGTLGGSKTQGGSTVINISYGVGGPNPEDAAQAVLNALHLGGRRGLTPQNGLPQGAH